MEALYDSPTEQLKPLSALTLRTCLPLLDTDSTYLPEVGDKLIKLAIQLVVRHLSFLLDKLTGNTLATERLLYLLDDLYLLEHGVTTQLMPAIETRVPAEGRQYVDALGQELGLRFRHISEPCLETLAGKVSARFVEGVVTSMKQVPSQYRMTGRQVSKASPGLEGAMRPLVNIGRGKLSETVRTRIVEAALDRGLREIAGVLNEVVAEERRLNESLSKYKRADED